MLRAESIRKLTHETSVKLPEKRLVNTEFKYIIGGANHGKYVTWGTENFKRKERIPNKESRSIFNWYTTTLIVNQKLQIQQLQNPMLNPNLKKAYSVGSWKVTK